MSYEHRISEEATTPHPHVGEHRARRETQVVEQPGSYTHVYDPYAGRRHVLYRWTQAIYLILGVIEGLIAIRFIISLLGANPNAPFTDLMYDLTDPLVAPFLGVFGTPQAGGSLFEPHSLLAMVVYLLLAWLVVKAIWVIFGETRSAVTRSTIHQHPEDV